jgi:hypothetical protein
MHIVSLLPLAALTVVVSACGSGAREQRARPLPQRDLTLVTQGAQVEIASPVEMQRVRPQRRTVRLSPSRQPTVRHAMMMEAVPVPAAEPVAPPLSSTPTVANNRELLPGKTVTLIPVSSAPSAGPDETGELPPVRGGVMVGHGGGRCRGGGRGPGIGIATAPRPDFR